MNEVWRTTATVFTAAAILPLLILNLPASYTPTTNFIHDFSNAEFCSAELDVLGLGATFGLAPPAAFETDSVWGWTADFNVFSRRLARQEYFDLHREHEPAADSRAPLPCFSIPSDFDPRSLHEDDYKVSEPLQTFLDTVSSALTARIEAAGRSIPNLSRRHRDALRNLRQRHDVIVIMTDKNLGLAVDSAASYDAHVRASLSVTHTRTQHTVAVAIALIITDCENAIAPFLDDELLGLPVWLTKFLRASFTGIPNLRRAYDIPKFYLLYKVHKEALGFRPITGNWCSPTQPAARLLAFILLPFVRMTSEYVRDGDAMNTLLYEFTLADDEFLVTYDVVNLYPSIPHALCLEMVNSFLERSWDEVNVFERIGSVTLIMALLKLVLSLNYCQYAGVVFLQMLGYATGTACGAEVAHLYLCEIFKTLFRSVRRNLRLHKRYVDDGFLVWRGPETCLRRFLSDLDSQHAAVRITFAVSRRLCIFLDLHLSVSASGAVESSVYQKEQNRFLYPLWNSEIPRSTLAGIAIGECIRYIKRCSRRADYIEMLKLFSQRLAARGWPGWFITKAFKRAPDYDERMRLLRMGPWANRTNSLTGTTTSPQADNSRVNSLALGYSASAARQDLQSVLTAHRHLLPSALTENATFLVSWRAARPLGGVIRYRLQDQPISAGDTGAAGNTSTPPPTSGSGTEDEESGDICLTQAVDLDGDLEDSGSSGGVFLDNAASGSPSEGPSSTAYVPTWQPRQRNTPSSLLDKDS